MLFLEYPKCSTCKKAKAFLKSRKVLFQERNIVTDNPSKEELKDWIKKSNKDINKFFNTSGLKYRELGLKDRLKEMNDDEKIELLSTDGMLVKRPILVCDNKVFVGFKVDEWDRIGSI